MIIGAAIGGVVGLIIFLVLFYTILRRRNRSRIRKRDIHAPTSPMTPDLPMQGESMMEAGFSRISPVSVYNRPFPPPPAPTMKRESFSRHSIAPSYYSNPSYGSDAGASSPRSSTALMISISPRSPPSARLALPRGSDFVMVSNQSLVWLLRMLFK